MVSIAMRIARKKRPAYTKGRYDTDCLRNFKSAAEEAGISPMQAWIVLAKKHFDALFSYAKDSNIPQSEPIMERAGDAMNYIILLIALAVDSGILKWDEPQYMDEKGPVQERQP